VIITGCRSALRSLIIRVACLFRLVTSYVFISDTLVSLLTFAILFRTSMPVDATLGAQSCKWFSDKRAVHHALTLSTGSGLACVRCQTVQAPQSSAFQYSWTPLITR
jgi:hypothetical protein